MVHYKPWQRGTKKSLLRNKVVDVSILGINTNASQQRHEDTRKFEVEKRVGIASVGMEPRLSLISLSERGHSWLVVTRPS